MFWFDLKFVSKLNKVYIFLERKQVNNSFWFLKKRWFDITAPEVLLVGLIKSL